MSNHQQNKVIHNRKYTAGMNQKDIMEMFNKLIITAEYQVCYCESKILTFSDATFYPN